MSIGGLIVKALGELQAGSVRTKTFLKLLGSRVNNAQNFQGLGSSLKVSIQTLGILSLLNLFVLFQLKRYRGSPNTSYHSVVHSGTFRAEALDAS